MSNKRLDINKVLKFKVTGLLDMDGNLLNQWTYKDYNQFREYFVQRVNTNEPVPKDSLHMNKSRPIYENQPIVRPNDFDEYWMNTPLKTTTE